MESQNPKFEVMVGSTSVNIVDKQLAMGVVIELIERMIPATKMRLIMVLLGRIDEYQRYCGGKCVEEN